MENGSTIASSVAVSSLAACACDDAVAVMDTRAAHRTGMKDAANAIRLLQQKWPRAFPVKYTEVRPLASSVTKTIAAEMRWNRFYTRGVVSVWKSRDAYCDAVLRGGERYDLDGEPTEEQVDDNSKDQALQRRTARAAKLRKMAAQK
jgi:sRNA-binding protein